MQARKWVAFTFLICGISLGAQISPHPTAIHGRVYDPYGAPVGTTPLELRAWNGSIIAQGFTNSNGGFEFDTSVPGPYELVVQATDQTAVVPVDANNLNDLEVHLTAAQPAGAHPPGDTVSLNDLNVSDKARGKLDAAARALAKNDPAKALEETNAAIALAPQWGHALFFRAVLEMDANQYDAAGADLKLANQYDPGAQQTLVALGKLYTAEGDYPDAEANLRRALAAPVPSWQAEFEMANLDLLQHRYTEAETMARAAIDSTPPAPASAFYLLAQAEYGLGQPHAAADFRTFLEAPPSSSPGYAAAVLVARRRLAELGQ